MSIKFCCVGSPTKCLYNLFSVRWPCCSLKVTPAFQTWQCLMCTIVAVSSRTVFKLWHSSLAWRPLSLKALSAIGTLISSSFLWHDGRFTHGIHLVYMLMLVSRTLTLIKRSQRIGRGGKQYLRGYGIQTAHVGRLTRGIIVCSCSFSLTAVGYCGCRN